MGSPHPHLCICAPRYLRRHVLAYAEPGSSSAIQSRPQLRAILRSQSPGLQLIVTLASPFVTSP